MLTELLRREKEAKIKPDPDIDAYMKVRNKSMKFRIIYIIRKLHFFTDHVIHSKLCRQQH